MAPNKPESPLAKLEERIKLKKKVTEKDIDKAIADELEAVDKLYGKPGQEAERDAHKEEIRKFGRRLSAEKADLYKAWQKGMLDFFERSRNELWKKGNEDLEAIHERPKKLEESYQKSRRLTDPDKGGLGDKKIDDYEGWDIFATRWTATTDAHNPTRNTLSGYLTAMGMDSENKASNEYLRAHKVYSDKVFDDLTYEDLEGKMGMGAYIKEISEHFPNGKLSTETEGYLVGLLKLAHDDYPEIYDSYREYLFGELDKINLDEYIPSGSNEYEKDAEKGHIQILSIASVQSAKEWVEIFTGMQKAFSKLKDDAGELSDKLGFEYNDKSIAKFLERDPKSITTKDREEMNKISKLVASEANVRVLTKKSETEKIVKEIKKNVDAYKGENQKELKDEMEAVLNKYAAIKVEDDSTPADLVGIVEELDDAVMRAHEIDSRVAGEKKEQKEKKEEKKEEVKEQSEFMKAWKNPEFVDPIFSEDYLRVNDKVKALPYRNDDGSRGGEIPSGTVLKNVAPKDQVKEVQGIRYLKVEYDGKKVWVDQSFLERLEPKEKENKEFLEEKHLKEISDGSKFKYELDAPKITTEGGQILILTQNKDIDRKVAWRINDYLRILTEREGSAFKKATAGVKIESIDDVRSYLDGYFVAKGKKKEAEDVRRFFGTMSDAYEHSVLQYETKPSFSTLRDDYEEKVLPAWDKVREEALMLPKRPLKKGSKTGKEVPEGGSGLDVLVGGGKVNEKYRSALRELNKYAKNPEKYPDGIDIALPFNNTTTPLNVHYVNGGRVVVEFGDTPVKRYTYPSMRELAGKMNRGHLQWIRTYDVMADKASYSGYESMVGKLDFVDKDKALSANKEWQLHLEFDWEGIFDDPDIYVRPLRDGKIQYKIQWENAKFNGKKWTAGVVKNFDAFINVMAHIRQWGNKYDEIPEARLKTEQLREYRYHLLADPSSFRHYESSIGRVVRMTTENDGSTYILDWGGGNDTSLNQNAMLRVKVDENGRYEYFLWRNGLPKITVRGSANTREEVAHVVAVERVKAGF